MSEKLNNSQEQVADTSGDGGADYPAFDPEAAKAARQQYKAEHPDAVEDIEKARAMAEAEDPYRENMRDIQNATTYHHEGDEATSGMTEQQESDFMASVKRGEALAYRHHRLEKALDGRPVGYGQTVAERTIQSEQTMADKAANRAAAEYDENKEKIDRLRQILNSETAEPTVVDNAEKARAMAEAEDPYRENMKDIYNFASNHYEGDATTAGMTEQQKEAFMASVKRGEALVREHNKDEKITGHPISNGQTVTERAMQGEQQKANKAANRAAAKYN